MDQMTADTSIYSSESEWGDRQCWEWGVDATSRVYLWGQRYTVRRYVYLMCRGSLVPGKRLVNTCGNSDCVSPYHHAPAGSSQEKPADNVGALNSLNEPEQAGDERRDLEPVLRRRTVFSDAMERALDELK